MSGRQIQRKEARTDPGSLPLNPFKICLELTHEGPFPVASGFPYGKGTETPGGEVAGMSSQNDSTIEIRLARLEDAPAIRRLTLETAEMGIPAHRDISNEQVQAVAEEGLKTLDRLIFQRRQSAVLVAVDTQSQQVVGFLILDFHDVEESTGEAQTFIHNLAVDPAYLGKWVGHRLVWRAAQITHERGLRYMSSRITVSNERALLSAIKMGFEVERVQLTMACGPEGRARMPGRPMAERGHFVDRLLRERRRQRKLEKGESS